LTVALVPAAPAVPQTAPVFIGQQARLPPIHQACGMVNIIVMHCKNSTKLVEERRLIRAPTPPVINRCRRHRAAGNPDSPVPS
jgi:hypothetical protein